MSWGGNRALVTVILSSGVRVAKGESRIQVRTVGRLGVTDRFVKGLLPF